MELRGSKKKSNTDTSGPPAESMSVVHINREEVTLPENRSTLNDGLSPNPPGRLGPDTVLPKSGGTHLGKSSKRRLKRKFKKQRKTEREGKKNKHQNHTMRLASWNVRTLTPGISDSAAGINDARKTAVIDKELTRLNIDIAALQETRLADSGTLREKNFTFFWKGKSEEERRDHGVGFAVSNKLLRMASEPTDGTERLLTMQLNTVQGVANIICAYAPTNCSTEETKDSFYEELDRTIKSIPSNEQIILLGDFNARVGNDYESWNVCLGRHGIGKMNNNGQRLLELCTHHNLCITNTLFKTKPHQQVSWRHPRSKLWHQLDLVITRRDNIKNVRLTRVFHSADCDTDHSLVACTLHLMPKKIHRAKPPGNPRINIDRAEDPKLAEDLSRRIELALPSPVEGNAEVKWTILQETIYKEAKETFGTRNNSSQDWFEADYEYLNPIFEKKRKALVDHKKNPTSSSKHHLERTCKEARQSARNSANRYWKGLSQEMQRAADTGNVRGVYEGMKKAIGPMPKKTAPIKDLEGNKITDKSKVMDRWVEHYGELYSRETKVTDEALDAIEELPCLSDLDEPPNMDEMMEAINSLPRKKAPGKDGITAEMVRAAKGKLSVHLLDLLQQCWREQEVPKDMRDSIICTLYKNKGDRSDCNNHRGISLLSIVGKCFARIALKRLQKVAEQVYPESQCGFRAKRSTTDMVFSLRQLQEKCREQGQPLYMVFIDLTKAFDLVSRDGLFKILPKIGCPPTLLSIIKSFHDDMQGIVQFDGNFSKPFYIRSGVKQGCVLAPTLFGIFFSLMLKHALGDSTEGILLHTRSDGKLFNLSRLKAKSKIRRALIRDMLFADDAAIVAHTQEELQRLMDRFSNACSAFGLTISIKKTEVMGQGVEDAPRIKVNNEVLVVSSSFTYLGSTISDDLSLNKELDRRIGKACTTFSKLSERVWTNKKLTIKTKTSVYSACVLSTLLYGCESWAIYATQEKRLNTFHMRCLRRILNIKWDDRVTNNEVLKRTGTDSLYSILKLRRLRWLGHVHRMQDGRIPKDLLYGELATGKRPQGRPRQCFRNVCKADLRETGIDVDSWEQLATNRDSWRQLVKHGVEKHEVHLRERAEEKRRQRKEKCEEQMLSSQHSDPAPLTSFSCPHCNQKFKAQPALYSHLRTHHHSRVDWSNGPLSTLSCPYCRTIFRTQSGLTGHLRTHHRSRIDWRNTTS